MAANGAKQASGSSAGTPSAAGKQPSAGSVGAAGSAGSAGKHSRTESDDDAGSESSSTSDEDAAGSNTLEREENDAVGAAGSDTRVRAEEHATGSRASLRVKGNGRKRVRMEEDDPVKCLDTLVAAVRNMPEGVHALVAAINKRDFHLAEAARAHEDVLKALAQLKQAPPSSPPRRVITYMYLDIGGGKVPKKFDYRAHVTVHGHARCEKDWPHMSDIAWQIVRNGAVVGSYAEEVRNFWTIVDKVERDELEHAAEDGVLMSDMFAALREAVQRWNVTYVVGHKVRGYDGPVLQAEAMRLGTVNHLTLWPGAKLLDTMIDEQYQRLYGTTTWQKLKEAYKHMMGKDWDGGRLHVSKNDVECLKQLHQVALARLAGTA